jgi:hypothetical protein
MKTNDGKMTPTRVLPGFLRRSLRMNYSDDQEDDDNDETLSPREASPAEPPMLPRKAAPVEESKSEASTADETVVSVGEVTSEPDRPEVPPKIDLERQVSYKDAMFEKAIGADVVNMIDLRRLGWNGIPVCAP